MSGRSGFTLLELVIAVTLLALVTASFGLLQSSALRAFFQSANWTHSQNEAAFGMEHIKRHLLLAGDITQPADPVAGNPASTTNGTVLTFQWASALGPPRIESTLTYQRNGDQLQATRTDLDTVTGASTIVVETIARNITDLQFTRTGAATTEVDIESSYALHRDTPRRIRLHSAVIPRAMIVD